MTTLETHFKSTILVHRARKSYCVTDSLVVLVISGHWYICKTCSFHPLTIHCTHQDSEAVFQSHHIEIPTFWVGCHRFLQQPEKQCITKSAAERCSRLMAKYTDWDWDCSFGPGASFNLWLALCRVPQVFWGTASYYSVASMIQCPFARSPTLFAH